MTNENVVLKWDTEGHNHGYKLWDMAMKADGGRRCQSMWERDNEPLIQGMVVGTEKDRLDHDQSNAVRLRRSYYHRDITDENRSLRRRFEMIRRCTTSAGMNQN